MTGVHWSEFMDRMDTMQVGTTLRLAHPCTAKNTRLARTTTDCKTCSRALSHAEFGERKYKSWCYMAELWVVRYA